LGNISDIIGLIKTCIAPFPHPTNKAPVSKSGQLGEKASSKRPEKRIYNPEVRYAFLLILSEKSPPTTIDVK